MSIKQFREIKLDIEEITDYYIPNTSNLDLVVEEGDYIADDILNKILENGSNTLKLPIDVSSIIEYCISSKMEKEQYYNTLLWIAIKYSTILQYISYKNWEKIYKEEKCDN